MLIEYSIVHSIALIAKQLLQRFARFILVRESVIERLVFAPDHFKVFAVVGHVFFRNRIGAALAALVRDALVEMEAVAAHF